MKNNYFFKRVLSAVVMLMVSSFMWAADFEVDGIYYYVNNDGNSVDVAPYDDWENPYSGDIVIPSTVNYEGKTYSVTGIGSQAFRGCNTLTSVEIPNSVTSIKAYAFSQCWSLTSVEIPNNVTSIGEKAFSNCSSLASVVIPNNVTSIGESAFYGCSSLTSVVIPNSVTSIEDEVFSGCSSLASVVIPSSVTSIGSYAFDDCSSLVSLEIPNSVTSIGNGAFQWCSSLTSVVIPNGVTSIEYGVFESCSSLTSVVIPSSVTSIGYYAFGNCFSLTSVICYAEDVPELGSPVFSEVPQSEAILYVPELALKAYKAADEWKEFGTILTIDDYITGITSTTAEQEADATYYTLDGVSVKNPTKKGIYIKNGKKVFINK